MKNIKRIVLVLATVVGLGVSGLAIAQAHRGALHHGDPALLVQHLTAAYPQVAAFDLNKDGQLDATEKEALAKALADGTLQLPSHAPPHGSQPTAEMMVNHIAEMYAQVSRYDANHDGELDAAEQAALKAALEKGEFAPHGLHPQTGGAQD